MDAHKLQLKLFAEPQAGLALEAFIPVFHRWIKERVLTDDTLVDVANYAHVPEGPGGMEFRLASFDLTNPANFNYLGFFDRSFAAAGSDWQVRTDLKVTTPLSFIPKVEAGFRFTTPRGDVRDRDAYIAGNTEGELVWRDQYLVEYDVVVAGDTAVLTGVVHDAFERAGQPGAHDMRITLVWVRHDGEWVVLAAHAGPPVE